MKNTDEINIENCRRINNAASFLASLLFHIVLFGAITLILNDSRVKGRINPGYVSISIPDRLAGFLPERDKVARQEIKENAREPETSKNLTRANLSGPVTYSFKNIPVDTTGLEQVYTEPTLNVSIKYPQNWTYIDQDKKDKLDGVTFWSTAGTYYPPPYVHFEVKDKDIFSAARYKYKIENDGNTLYYNDPEETEDQVMQTVYIRTGTDEDFSVKLIMNGRNAFDSFQPVFFGMIKSFKFGHSLF